MANDNIKRYLDYDGLAYLINKFNSVIEANEYTTSEALNDLNKKIAELNFNDNTGGFPIIDADITQVDSVYTTTENLNELITPGQYIVDSSKIQYEEDNFVKTLYWLLSVDKVIYNNSESIVQTYFPLSYLTYSWHDIPIGGLLQRFYEGNNTWTDLQVASPGDVDPSKFVTKNEFDTNINTINTNINNINETIKGLSKTDNDTKCISATINVSDAPVVSENEVDVIAKQQITLTSKTGESLLGDATSVKVVTKKYVEENYIPKSESDSIWEAINEGRVDNISLEKSNITKTITTEEVNVPYINNKISFIEGPTGSFVGKFDVISLPTKNYIINNYVSNQTLTNYVDKASVIPNILKNGTPQASGDKNKSLQWYQTSEAITDTNSTDYHDICAPSYNDFNETSSLYNINSMVIRAFWSESYFHDIWMSPNTDHILHRSISNEKAKPWKILLDNSNCGKYVKDVVNNNIIDIANFKNINIPLSTNEGLEIQDGKAIIGTNILDLSTALDQQVRAIHSTPTDYNYNEYTDLSIILNNSVNKTYLKEGEEYPTSYSLCESLSIGYYDVSKNKNVRIGSFYTYAGTGRVQGRFDLDGELCVHDDDNKEYLIFEHNNNSASEDNSDPRSTGRHVKWDENNNNIIEDISFNSLFSVNSERQIFVTDHFSIKDRNYNSDKQDNFSDPYEYSDLFRITDSSANFYVPLYVNNSQVLTSSNISSNLPSTVITTNNISHIEFKPSSGASNGGFIDFHYGGSTKDFTSRIIEDAEGAITISASTLKVTGNINVSGGVFETSDETLKDFQDSIQVNFEQLKEIPKAYFTFKDDKTGETKIGTSAQKVKEFYPELVSEDENGILSVDYAKLSIIALKAVDELDDRITKLEKLVEQLINNK